MINNNKTIKQIKRELDEISSEYELND